MQDSAFAAAPSTSDSTEEDSDVRGPGSRTRRRSRVVLLAEEGETSVQWAITRVSMPAPGSVAAVE